MEKLQELKLILEAGENAHDALCLYIVAGFIQKLGLLALAFTFIFLVYKLIRRAMANDYKMKILAYKLDMDTFDANSTNDRKKLYGKLNELAEAADDV